MSIVCYVLRAPSAVIAQVRADHDLLAGVTQHASQSIWNAHFEATLKRLAPEEAATMRKERDDAMKKMRAMPDLAAEFERLAAAQKRAAALNVAEALCLDKQWHILHFALTGSSGLTGEPADALMSGEEVGADAGYGPPRVHDPDAARAFADFLAAQDFAALLARAGPDAMKEARLYGAPGAIDELLATMLSDDFVRLRDYTAHARDRGEGMITWLA
ncbi:MAG: DUF1877 family protein [Hyphomonadaceae bacterium]|nr:DUF1877 family protein [Hyphomonadaceae bacterium]